MGFFKTRVGRTRLTRFAKRATAVLATVATLAGTGLAFAQGGGSGGGQGQGGGGGTGPGPVLIKWVQKDSLGAPTVDNVYNVIRNTGGHPETEGQAGVRTRESTQHALDVAIRHCHDRGSRECRLVWAMPMPRCWPLVHSYESRYYRRRLQKCIHSRDPR